MDKNRLYNWTLEEEKQESRKIIRKAIEKFGMEKVSVAWSGGKDSTTVLHLIKQEFKKVIIPGVFYNEVENIDYLREKLKDLDFLD